MQLSISLLGADFSNLEGQTRLASLSGAKYLHFDVMDGHFVPNISFGSIIMKSLEKNDLPPFDVHLMISDPKKYFIDFITPKSEFIVFHYEAIDKQNREEKIFELINLIKEKNIKPKTNDSSFLNLLKLLSLL